MCRLTTAMVESIHDVSVSMKSVTTPGGEPVEHNSFFENIGVPFEKYFPNRVSHDWSNEEYRFLSEHSITPGLLE